MARNIFPALPVSSYYCLNRYTQRALARVFRLEGADALNAAVNLTPTSHSLGGVGLIFRRGTAASEVPTNGASISVSHELVKAEFSTSPMSCLQDK